jgi:hypothetical protein
MWEYVELGLFGLSFAFLVAGVLFFRDAHKMYEETMEIAMASTEYSNFIKEEVCALVESQMIKSNYCDPNPAKNIWYPLGLNK